MLGSVNSAPNRSARFLAFSVSASIFALMASNFSLSASASFSSSSSWVETRKGHSNFSGARHQLRVHSHLTECGQPGKVIEKAAALFCTRANQTGLYLTRSTYTEQMRRGNARPCVWWTRKLPPHTFYPSSSSLRTCWYFAQGSIHENAEFHTHHTNIPFRRPMRIG